MTRNEILIGGAIVGVVVAAATFVVTARADSNSDEEAHRTAREIRAAAARWQDANRSDTGCPTLSQLKEERHLDVDVTTDDPWGRRYRVRCTDGGIVVISAGPDGRAGTADDVTDS